MSDLFGGVVGKSAMKIPEVGDVVEQILLPCAPTLRGSHACPYGPEWYFRLWRAEVIEVNNTFLGKVEVSYDVKEIEVLKPDDPRVLNYLKQEFTPPEGLLK